MDMLTALDLQVLWGADEALDELPIDRRHSPAADAPAAAPLSLVPIVPVQAAIIAQARLCANAASNVEALRAALAGFTACPLAATATRLVFADGNPTAGLVLIDDTPGAEEDLSGRPMVGPAGQLLDRMLASIGLDRTSLLITNLIPWRPPGGRQPTEAEIAMCLPFLRRHLALLRPRLIVSLGTGPAQALSGLATPLRKLRGVWLELSLPDLREQVPLLAMTHPATLLRTPSAKKDAWADLLAVQQRLKGQ